MIFTAFAFAENPTLVSWIKTFTVFLLTLCFTTLAALLHLAQTHPEFERLLVFACILIECFWVAGQGIDNSLLMILIGLAVATVSTVTIFVAENLEMETLTIHFQAFGFAAVAANLLKFCDFFYALFLSELIFYHWCFLSLKSKYGLPLGGLRFLDIHHHVLLKNFRLVRQFERTIGYFNIITRWEWAIAWRNAIVVTFGLH